MAVKLPEGFLRYVQNTGYLFLEKIARTIVTLTVWTYVIRYLGPEQFGVFSYALSFVFLFNILSDLSLDAVAVKELIAGSRKNELLGSIFFLKSVGAILAIILIVAATSLEHFDAGSRSIILIMALRMIFQSLGGIDYYFQSRVLSKFTVCSQLLGLASTTALCLLFVHFQKPLTYFAYVVVVEAAVIAAGWFFSYRQIKEKIFSWRIDFKLVKKLLKNVWPLILSGMAISVYMRIDQILLKNMLGVAAVGQYSAAVRVSEVFYFIPMVIAASLFPAIVSANISNRTLYQNRARALFALLAVLSLAISVLMTVFSPLLIRILFGPQYMPAASVLSIHAWANLFVFWGIIRTRLLINENLQIYSVPYLAITAVANIILNLILIPTCGIQGAAIATVISQFIASVLSNLFSAKTRHLFYLQMSSLNFFKVLKGRILTQ